MNKKLYYNKKVNYYSTFMKISINKNIAIQSLEKSHSSLRNTGLPKWNCYKWSELSSDTVTINTGFQ